MELLKEIHRLTEASEDAENPTTYQAKEHPEEGDDMIYKVSSEQGVKDFVEDGGYGSVEKFEQATGVSADELIAVGWFSLVNDRIHPIDELNK